MHTAIKLESNPTQHKELGLIGKDNLLARLQNVRRFWYEKESGDIYGFPFIFEVLIAESYDNQGTYFFGINHSPTYSDFLSGVVLVTDKMGGHGIEGLLHEVIDTKNHVVVCHLVCPNLNFKDKGKSSLEIPNAVAKILAAAIGKTAKIIQRELKNNLNAYDKEQREMKRRQQSEKVTMKDAVFSVLADAISKATSDGKYPANVRALYYKVREFVQQHTPEELNYTYFSQNLLIEYWRNNGRNPNIYNDPRGVLHHPHDLFQLPMGTFEVDRYKFPEYRYNKILYIEKKGLCNPIQAAQLPEKYDMALIGGEGYACEAVRILLDRAQTGENYIIFVLHDADPDGYNIARTLQEETARMPNHNITVIDLGLTLQSGLDMKLEGENKKRKKELPSTLELTDDEREFFQGDLIKRSDNKKEWLGKIIELNAMSSDQLIQYVDTGISSALESLNQPYKIVPPEEILEAEAFDIRTEKLKELAKDRILEELDIEDMVEQLVDSIAFDDQTFTDEVSKYLLEHEFQTWRKGLDVITDNQLSANESVFNEKLSQLIANF